MNNDNNLLNEAKYKENSISIKPFKKEIENNSNNNNNKENEKQNEISRDKISNIFKKSNHNENENEKEKNKEKYKNNNNKLETKEESQKLLTNK
jgi:hypothetical protein